jgi:hypothetical protein
MHNGLVVVGQEALELEAVGKYLEEFHKKGTTLFTSETV